MSGDPPAASEPTRARVTVERPLGWSRMPAVRAWAALREPAGAAIVAGALVLVATGVRIWLTRRIAAPWIMGDELEYSEAAKGFAASGHFLFRDAPTPFLSAYPALISPAWLTHSMSTTYELAKAINVVLMTSAAIPLFLWARRLVPPVYAVLATGLFLLLPTFVYTGELMTENAFVPAFMLAAFAFALALERPTIVRQLLALAAIVPAVAVRRQGVVLVVVLLTAVLLKALLDLAAGGRWDRRTALGHVRRYWATFAALAVLVVLYVLYKAIQGATLSSGLGNYSSTVSAQYSARVAARWVLDHFAELGFAVGILPAMALVVVAALGRLRDTLAPAERSFVAVAVAAIWWVVLVVGVFASRFALRIEERPMAYVAPLFVLALVVWLARGLPRPPGATAVAVVLPTALLLALPIESFFNGALFNDTFGLIPLWRLAQRLGSTDEMRALLALGLVGAGALFAAVPRRIAQLAVPAVAAAFFLLSSHSVLGTITGLSQATRHAYGLSGNPSWIDQHVGRHADCAFLYTHQLDADEHVLWQSEFWNRSVGTVYGLAMPVPGISGTDAALADGNVVSAGVQLAPRCAVVFSGYTLAGSLLARNGALALYRTARPLRLTSSQEGIYPDGWTGADAAYAHYTPAAPRRTLEVRLTRPAQRRVRLAHVQIVVGSLVLGVAEVPSLGTVTARKTAVVRSNRATIVRIRLPGGPYLVQIHASPTFSPASFGSPDTRQLGVLVRFRQR